MSLNIQDFLAIVTIIVGPIGTLIGFMWHDSNTKFMRIDEKFMRIDEKIDEKFESLRGDISNVEKSLRENINSVEKSLGEKINTVSDRVSRIEGQLATFGIIEYSTARHKEPTTGYSPARHKATTTRATQ